MEKKNIDIHYLMKTTFSRSCDSYDFDDYWRFKDKVNTLFVLLLVSHPGYFRIVLVSPLGASTSSIWVSIPL